MCPQPAGGRSQDRKGGSDFRVAALETCLISSPTLLPFSITILFRAWQKWVWTGLSAPSLPGVLTTLDSLHGNKPHRGAKAAQEGEKLQKTGRLCSSLRGLFSFSPEPLAGSSSPPGHRASGREGDAARLESSICSEDSGPCAVPGTVLGFQEDPRDGQAQAPPPQRSRAGEGAPGPGGSQRGTALAAEAQEPEGPGTRGWSPRPEEGRRYSRGCPAEGAAAVAPLGPPRWRLTGRAPDQYGPSRGAYK
ncbi:unnamed protein product [Rangifer tarandus platyrhynchus]|uniref:Uncharacterized protein n=2 Tax=Rangifer tarandus platyrhynchus TaxID=3082113 RepID=A0ABN8YJD6_RANTA|nr:unnamed protein product [Rangifer tarandus platyrhynchus]CAI9700283.1 unnamed protein product [Rangifer tarandus platyrhynchus]